MDKAAIAALANAIQIINRVGTSADGSGVASLFGKLAAVLADTALIKGYTDQVEGYVDTLESLVGTANPASGDLTTLFKGLKLIADYVDTLETKVGTNADAAGTTTLFARLAQLAGYTDTVESNVGSNADASSATGSAHAKLKDVKAAVSALKPLPAGSDQWGGTTTSAQSNTLLDITGSGWLMAVGIPGSEASPGNISIQADGGTVRNINGSGHVTFCLRFDTSLLVKSSSAGSAGSWAMAVLD